jgi:hypothetical protein
MRACYNAMNRHGRTNVANVPVIKSRQGDVFAITPAWILLTSSTPQFHPIHSLNSLAQFFALFNAFVDIPFLSSPDRTNHKSLP